jgi:hypothetical protein
MPRFYLFVVSAHSTLDVIQLPCVHVHEVRQDFGVVLYAVYRIP